MLFLLLQPVLLLLGQGGNRILLPECLATHCTWGTTGLHRGPLCQGWLLEGTGELPG